MSEISKRSLELRALLTDTLPYEVPVIFSNDRLHVGLSAARPESMQAAIGRMTSPQQRPHYTVPYCYGITKDRERRTTLSIVHPVLQIDMARFYELHAAGMLSHCSRGEFSIRKPMALASPFASEVAADDDQARSGIPQLLAQADEPDPSHMTSYFVYGKYNLLGKFVASREYIRLEERHALMRTIDVSKCFYNIYTHSITWAVKSKPFAKTHRDTYSFESAFDKLMQRSNYNETNGIVVGPEISRIFAEIILQDIDECVKEDLVKDGLQHGRHYDIRRYVDDYFVFTGNHIDADRIEASIRTHLERYKLYVNERKINTYQRPFVSDLTIAREHVATVLRDVSRGITAIQGEEQPGLNAREARALRAKLNRIRLIVAEHGIQFANLSGWLLSRLRRIVTRCSKLMSEAVTADARDPYSSIIVSALETALYICSVDLRVRTTYSLCQLIQVLSATEQFMPAEQYDLATHLIADGLSGLIRRQTPADGKPFQDNIELYNLLICGAHFIGEDFISSAAFTTCVQQLMKGDTVSYFAYITLKFCMLKRPSDFAAQLQDLNQKAYARITAPGVDIWRDTEEYLLAVDYISSPDVDRVVKQATFQLLFGTVQRLTTMDEVGAFSGFADWTGLSVDHQLRRKALRPVYAWT